MALICIDFGGGVTSVSVFMNGAPAWLDLVKVGGARVTGDIAQGIGTTFAAAERLKTLHGTADKEGPGMAERIEAPRLGDDGRLKAGRMTRGELTAIIEPRIEELFEMVQAHLTASPLRPIHAETHRSHRRCEPAGWRARIGVSGAEAAGSPGAADRC